MPVLNGILQSTLFSHEWVLMESLSLDLLSSITEPVLHIQILLSVLNVNCEHRKRLWKPFYTLEDQVLSLIWICDANTRMIKIKVRFESDIERFRLI